MNETQQCLHDLAKWWDYNKDRVPPDDLRKRHELMQNCLEGLFTLVAMMVRDDNARSRGNLVLPPGFGPPH